MPGEYPNVKKIYWELFHSKELNLNDNDLFEKTENNNRFIVK